MNSVVNLKFLCRGLVSTTYTSLCHDTEKSYCNIKLPAISALCRDIEKLCHDMGFSFMLVLCRDLKAYVAIEKSPRQDNLCCNTGSPIATLNLLLPPFPVVTSFLLTLANSVATEIFPVLPTMSQHNFLVATQNLLTLAILYRDIKLSTIANSIATKNMLSRQKTPGLAKLCLDIKPFCRNKKSHIPGHYEFTVMPS